MTPVPVRLALRRTVNHIQHVRAVRPAAATGLVREVYRQVEHDFGMLAPPVALHSAAPGALAASWVILRETLVARGLAGRKAKETVAAAVSSRNACPYCVEVHTAAIGGNAATSDITAAAGEAVPDPELGLANWVYGGEPPLLPDGELIELAGVAVTFEYLNRMVNLFLPESPLPRGAPAIARKGAHRLFARLASAGPHNRPGESLRLLADESLPQDFQWASKHTTVAAAFGRAAGAFEEAGNRAVSDPVRALVLDTLDGWNGKPPGIGRSWVEPLIARVSSADRPAARLLLLTAIAAYQVDDEAVADFRESDPGDRRLIECTSWASFAAARRARQVLYG